MAKRTSLNNIFNDNAPKTLPEQKKELSNFTDEKKVFSFRGEKSDVKAWRLYANIVGLKVDDLGSLALNEYLNKHPLNEIENALFQERMKS